MSTRYKLAAASVTAAADNVASVQILSAGRIKQIQLATGGVPISGNQRQLFEISLDAVRNNVSTQATRSLAHIEASGSSAEGVNGNSSCNCDVAVAMGQVIYMHCNSIAGGAVPTATCNAILTVI